MGRLRPSVLLFLQLLAVALLALTIAEPVRITPAPLAAHTVFIIDASGSMAAEDGSPDRLADAKATARDLRGQLPAGGIASVVVASDRPRVVLTASSDGDGSVVAWAWTFGCNPAQPRTRTLPYPASSQACSAEGSGQLAGSLHSNFLPWRRWRPVGAGGPTGSA